MREHEIERASAASSSRAGRVGADAVSATGVALVLANRGGTEVAPGWETLVIMAVVALLAVACVLIAVHLRRRSRKPKPVADQWQAMAVMGELCPHGWQAQITLYGWGAPIPADAPSSRVPLVELEWKQFDEEPGRVVVARRVWAPTIGEALHSMVEDRRTDVALEQIEWDIEGEEGWP